jgi:hypothetical protein
MPSARYESVEDVAVERLALPLQLAFSNKVAKNRLMKSAMAESLATWSATDLQKRGIPTKELVELYGR